MDMAAPLRGGAEASARDPHRFAPVFLLATARSCSSVVTAMIGQHPALCGLPELKLFASPTIGEMEASLPRFWIERGVTHRSPGLVRALAEYLFGGQNIEALAAARTWLAERQDWPGEAVLDILLERLSPRLAIEKSPENAASDEALARLAEAYPEARYIHLTREPAATQRSMQAHWERVMPEHPLEGQPMLGFAAWVDVNRRLLAFGESLPAGRLLRLRAEDILDGTSISLRRVASWLGVDCTPAAIAAMGHPEASPFACPGPEESGIIGGYDPGFLAHPHLRQLAPPPALRRPEGWSGHDALWEMVADLAERLGCAG
jgi:Sulfotransferase family